MFDRINCELSWAVKLIKSVYLNFIIKKHKQFTFGPLNDP